MRSHAIPSPLNGTPRFQPTPDSAQRTVAQGLLGLISTLHHYRPALGHNATVVRVNFKRQDGGLTFRASAELRPGFAQCEGPVIPIPDDGNYNGFAQMLAELIADFEGFGEQHIDLLIANPDTPRDNRLWKN
jgi:hypothetical protein